ncbi:hypothetical protein [Heyndrickxia oleronia]|jgi:hypothetical protein|uniref:hypothetical protein n=1 Tax=Heyndrickxia oleronia TaxID=38875 RepID=UPI00242E31DA|nr:hypothetical protein [Heyndrickxia oleronia]MCI1590386.1 hypothetical protein [Heyndrickxia oleronia]MCI1611352.1 hypothetical protein [Heyndrickxia oleronia]MCI1742795.1 hypothetical protein [Heyndrickxia oleronia]MCI1763120.1 hypothetical protein [Heyndrickxia oleronia]
MINIIGLVVLVDKNFTPDIKTYIKENNIAVEVIDYQNKVDINGQPTFEITCKFKIQIPENETCESIDDYIGFVFPFLRKYLNNIERTEVYHLSKMTPSLNQSNIRHISNIVENLSTGE